MLILTFTFILFGASDRP